MKRGNSLLIFLLQSVAAGLALAFIVILSVPSLRHALQSHLRTEAPTPTVTTFADAVDRTAPSVVSIYTQTVELQEIGPELQRIMGRQYVRRNSRDMGSGVLIREDGYILTNNHVVSNVSNIQVGLWDGRFASAEIVGSDPATDLAVLRVDLNGLPTAPLAMDSAPRVGDVVLAIGNALGLSHTVTMGIVSATGRNDLRSVMLEDFIQTDAAINAGNSGGALINARGEVIGISTRNLDRATGGQNIGFAIPINLARSVMDQIIEYGSVRRGWLGANFMDQQRLTLQADGSTVRRGVLVLNVSAGSPAWNANLRAGDVLLALNGEATDDARSTLLTISRLPPGAQIGLLVERNGNVFESYAQLIQQPPLR